MDHLIALLFILPASALASFAAFALARAIWRDEL